jgi:hypothetical protein
MATQARPDFSVVYPTLPDSATYIRLLQLVADPTHEPQCSRVCITIITIPFTHAIPYGAVSYTWGNSSEEEEIMIIASEREERMIVRKNCGDVLRQIGQLGTTKYYWVDAICINQSDEHEKSYQVAMMGAIFSRADHVLACIGMPHNGGQSLACFLREFDNYLASGGQSTASFIKALHQDHSLGYEQCLYSSEQWLNELSEARTVRFCEALDEVAELPYFERIWILQELFLARRIRIICGFEELSLSSLLFWWQHSRPEWSFDAQGGDKPLLYKQLCRTGRGLGCIEKRRRKDPCFFTEDGESRVGAAYEYFLKICALSVEFSPTEKKRMCLRSTLNLCEGKKCKDERDTVYGTLALVDWSDMGAITPYGQIIKIPDSVLRSDYTKSAIDLARELLPFLDHFGQMLQVLKMLKITSTQINISEETARRQHVGRSARIESDGCVVSLAKESGQRHAHVVGRCMQLTSKGPWRLKYLERHGRRYCAIVGPKNLTCGITSVGIHTGDWIFLPTRCYYGIVIRQINATTQFYAIVGRVAWFPGEVPEYFKVTGFVFFLGVDDAMVHLTQDVNLGDKWSERSGLSVASHAALNLPFCATRFSSFAVLPDSVHTYSEEEFDIENGGDRITLTLLAKCRRKLMELQGYDFSPSE